MSETITCIYLRPGAPTEQEIEILRSKLESGEMQSMDLGRWWTHQGQLITLWAYLVEEDIKSDETSNHRNNLFTQLLRYAGISRLAWPKNPKLSAYVYGVSMAMEELDKQILPLTVGQFLRLRPSLI
jgi:hypothetical protein